MAENAKRRGNATPLQVMKAVLSAFIGIRKRAAHEHDIATLTPLQVIVAGVICAAVLALSLVMLVRVITSR